MPAAGAAGLRACAKVRAAPAGAGHRRTWRACPQGPAQEGVQVSWFSRFRQSGAGSAAALSALGPPLLGGRYQVGQALKRGGMSEVFEAVDMRHGRPVVVKFSALPPDLTPEARHDLLARLQREAQVARQLHHPGIVALLGAGLLPHQAWLAMERVQGADLGRYTQPGRLLPEPVVLRIGARLAAALAHAHAHGVVHRDLKPANVLVDLAGRQVKLADFGVARTTDSTITRTGVTLGTPAYMAPEQLVSGTGTPASDTYALGVLLYELLTGRRPHQADSLGLLLRSMAHAPPTPLAELRPDLPAPIAQHLSSLLATAPEQRPNDLARWAAQLDRLVQALVQATTPGAAPPL